jgi:hopanoid biosynthesis associated protein HpnK
VGLHLVLCEGRALLPRAAISGLTTARGELYSPLHAVLRFLARPRLRDELAAEIAAQFEAFRSTGLRLDHVNGHNNLQLHPVVLPLLLRLAREYGARAIRIPYEPFAPSFRKLDRSLPLRLLGCLFLRPWSAWVRAQVKAQGFLTNDYLFGMYDCGALSADWFVHLLRHLPDGVSEIHCHPATRRCPELERTMRSYRHATELGALLSRDVVEALSSPTLTLLSGFDALCADG